MPQASDELRAKFPGSDQEAVEVLGPNFLVHFPTVGMIRKRDPDYVPTDREWDAIDYLIQEWDYWYGEVDVSKPDSGAEGEGEAC